MGRAPLPPHRSGASPATAMTQSSRFSGTEEGQASTRAMPPSWLGVRYKHVDPVTRGFVLNAR
jgi:hypothetical protein